jgi:peptidoglycan/LPS O-acetylase OafA/YrhL
MAPASTLPAFVLQTAVLAAVILLVSGVFFVLVERPCMERDWPQRLAARVRAWLPSAPRPATAAADD